MKKLLFPAAFTVDLMNFGVMLILLNYLSISDSLSGLKSANRINRS